MSTSDHPEVAPPSPAGEAVYQARWLTPDCEQTYSPGCLHVCDGRIVRVWEGRDADAIDLGEVVVAPGLVNAHTHLEFSGLATPLAAGAAFPDWIRSVIASRQTRSDDVCDAIRNGWHECRHAGTAAIGEIATDDASYGVLHAKGAAGVVFQEILGLQESQVAAGLDTARRFVRRAPDGPTHQMRADCPLPVKTADTPLVRGISPHAPYSLHPQLFRGLVDLAAETGVPVAMHLAETREELQLLADHSGGLVDLLDDLGLWRLELFTEFRRPLDYLRELSRCRRTLVVHGNYLDREELDFLATQPQMSVVYCPRTHAAFGHAPHPWRAMQDRGIRVVFGTDSRASNPDLSLLSELEFLHRMHPEISAKELLRMATLDAAASLGLSDWCGTLTPGLTAAFTVGAVSGDKASKFWTSVVEADG